MTPGQAVKAIQQRWLERWPAASLAAIGEAVPFSLDNATKSDARYFARLKITSGTSEQWTMGQTGNRKFQRTGFIDVRISGPVGDGRGNLDDLAHEVTEIYEAVRFGKRAGEHGVQTFASSPAELTKDKQAPQSWIVQVVTPFEFFEVR